jgi:hypothetical protein
MAVLSVRVTEEGVSVPEGVLRDLGLEPGDNALVEVRKAPDAATIAALAKHYAWRSLGDALGIGEPQWDGEVWRAPVFARGVDEAIGHLTLSAEGQVLAERSSDKKELLESFDAARARSTAAR